MKKRLFIIVVILLVGLSIWRFWPHSFTNVISVDETSIVDFSAVAVVNGFENGKHQNEIYHIDAFQSNSSILKDAINLLEASSYQKDYRNLLPWSVNSVDSDKNYDDYTIDLLFSFGYGVDEYISVKFLSSSIIVVSIGGESGFHIYHPTNNQTIHELLEYIKLHDNA